MVAVLHGIRDILDWACHFNSFLSCLLGRVSLLALDWSFLFTGQQHVDTFGFRSSPWFFLLDTREGLQVVRLLKLEDWIVGNQKGALVMKLCHLSLFFEDIVNHLPVSHLLLLLHTSGEVFQKGLVLVCFFHDRGR